MKDRKLAITSALVIGAITVLTCAAVSPVSADVTGEQLKNLYGSDLQVLGDVESIDLAHGVLVVAGQHVSIGQGTAISYNCVPMSDQTLALQMIRPGDLVAATGQLDAPVQSVSRLKEAYVAGATTVFVRAKVAVREPSLGRATVDQLSVDLTPAMADVQFANVESGQIIEAVGTRPVAGGVLFANTVSPSSIVGTSAEAKSIVGTSAAKSIVGTSLARPDSIVGTSAEAKSIVGTSAARSIVGTSLARPDSIVGTSAEAKSIVGTSAAKSIVGTSLARPDSIVGTSAAAKSIVGTSAARSIVGTSAAKSIVGTSLARPDSIVGTSAEAKSIVGTSATKSIVGTSLARPDSIVGTSAAAKSIVGTSAARSIVGTSAAKSIVGTSL